MAYYALSQTTKARDSYRPMRPNSHVKQRERAWDESFHMASSLDRVPIVHGTRVKAPKGYIMNPDSSRDFVGMHQHLANQGGIPVILREETPSPVQSMSPTKMLSHNGIPQHPLSRSTPDHKNAQNQEGSEDPFQRSNPLSRSSPVPPNSSIISPRGALVPLAPSIQHKGRRAQTAPTRRDGTAASRMELKTLREQVGELSTELLQCRRQHQAIAISQQNKKKKSKQQSQAISTLKSELQEEQKTSADLRQQLSQQRTEMKKMQKTMESAAEAMKRVQSQEEMIDDLRRQMEDLRNELQASEDEKKMIVSHIEQEVEVAEQPLMNVHSADEEVGADEGNDYDEGDEDADDEEAMMMEQAMMQAAARAEGAGGVEVAGAGGPEDPENILGRAALLGVPDLSLNTLIAAMEQMVEEKQSLEGTCQILVAQKEMTESRVMFMDMDRDRDGLISRENLLGCQELTLPPFVVDRAFGGWVCSLTSKVRGKMNMADFLKFRDWVDDACTSNKSLLCWFRCLDVDGDGIITFDDLKVVFREVMDFVQQAQQQQAEQQQEVEQQQQQAMDDAFALQQEQEDARMAAAADSEVGAIAANPGSDAADEQSKRMQQQIQLVKGDVDSFGQAEAEAAQEGKDVEEEEGGLESSTETLPAQDQEDVGDISTEQEEEEEEEEEDEEGDAEDDEESADAADLAQYQAKIAEGPRLDVYLSRLSDMVQSKEVGRFTLSELKKAPLRGEFVQVALQPWWSKY